MYSLEQIFIKHYVPLTMEDADTDRKTRSRGSSQFSERDRHTQLSLNTISHRQNYNLYEHREGNSRGMLSQFIMLIYSFIYLFNTYSSKELAVV